MSNARRAAIGAALQFVNYVLLTINYRAIAHEHYAFAGVTALTVSLLGGFAIKRLVKDETPWTIVGMAVGGGLADMVGIWLTRTWGQ